MTAQLGKIKNLKKILALAREGFTLVELIVVIAIIAVLAAAVVVAIDPLDKIASGNDAKAQSDMNEVYAAAQRYFADGGTTVPTNFAASSFTVGTTVELRQAPVAPSGYTYGIKAGTGNDVIVCATQKSRGAQVKAGATYSATGSVSFVICGGVASFQNVVANSTCSTVSGC